MARGINLLTQLPRYWYDEWMKGQDRIAELQGENKRLTEKCANIPDTWGELLERAEQAEAELAALKASRCTNCGMWSRCWIQDASVSHWGEEHPDDVWCERWSERGVAK